MKQIGTCFDISENNEEEKEEKENYRSVKFLYNILYHNYQSLFLDEIRL